MEDTEQAGLTVSMVHHKILLLSTSYPRKEEFPGSTSMVLAEMLVKTDMDVGVLVFSKTKQFREYNRNGVRVIEYPYTRLFPPLLHTKNELLASVRSGILPKFQVFGLAIATIRCLLKYGREYDLIHAFWFIPSGLLLALANKILRKPVLLTSLGTDLHSIPKNAFFITLYKFINRNYNHIVTCSGYLKKHAMDFGVNPEKIRIIYTCAKTEYHNLPRKPHDKIVIAAVARLMAFKRIDELISAASQIESDKFRILIIGDGPERGRLENQVKTMAMENKVTFLGWIEDVHNKLSEVDILVNPSINEGLSTVLIEAITAGCVPIATKGHGPDEIIDNGLNGFLYESTKVEQLRDILTRLIEDDALREDMSKRAKEKSAHFDVNVFCEKYRELYSQVIVDKQK
ncbi:glycosyltransferase family 4 protein [candidate division KSB1 bacterium]